MRMSALDDVIGECRALEETGATQDDAQSVYAMLAGTVPEPKQGLDMFRCRSSYSPPYSPREATADVHRLRVKAELFRDAQEREMRMAELAAQAARSTVTVEQHAAASASASATQELALALDALAALPRTEGDAAELALGRAKRAAKAGDARAFAEQALKVAELAAKAADLAPKLFAALGALAGLFGA